MEAAIVQILAGIIGYLAARGLDKIIAKWVAYATVAWEAAVSDEASRVFRENVQAVKEGMAKNGNDIVEWRRRHVGAPKEGGS